MAGPSHHVHTIYRNIRYLGIAVLFQHIYNVIFTVEQWQQSPNIHTIYINIFHKIEYTADNV